MFENRPGTNSQSFTARWVFPIDQPPLEHGIVTIAGERIVAVERRGEREADVDLGEAALLPGLVNAHTHLDLSGLRGQTLPGGDFTAWLRKVIAFRRRRTPEEVAADIRAGVAESLACGTTMLGDISTAGESWPALLEGPLRAIVFYELLGLPRQRAEIALEAADAWLKTHQSTEMLRAGLSPHAPYSVRASLFRDAAEQVQLHALPLATHLAESRDELRLLGERAGPFVDFLRALDVYDPDGLVRDPQQVLDLNAAIAHLLVVHANYLPPETRWPRGGTVVYCPRTHAAFGHEPHPFGEFLAAGVRVAVGTDSLASNPDLSVLEEVRFLHRTCPQVPGEVLLRMATLAGAEALGWGDEAGSLTPGKSADLIVVPLSRRPDAEPHEVLLGSSAAVSGVLFRGRWLPGGA